MFKLLKEIAQREGIGDLMAEGGIAFGSKYGHPSFSWASRVWGYLPGIPRLSTPWVSSMQHAIRVAPIRNRPCPSMKAEKILPSSWSSQKKDQDYLAAADSGILCWIIYHGPLWGEKLSQWLTYVTGTSYTPEGLEALGERIWNLELTFQYEGWHHREG